MRLIALLVLTFSTMVGAEVLCTTDRLQSLDPQQGGDYLQKQLSAKIYRPLFGKTGLITSKANPSPNIWKLTLAPAMFESVPGFKKRNIEALDLKYSLERQLAPYAKTQYEAQTLVTSKLNGLSRTIKSIRVLGPKEIELVFDGPTTDMQLEQMLSVPVGYVVPKDFKLPFSQKFSIFPPTKKISVTFNDTTLTSKGEENFSLKFVPLKARNAEGMKKLECKRLYYPPAEMLAAASEKKLKAVAIKVSKTKFFFRRNSAYPLTKENFARLQAALNPGNNKFLDEKYSSTQKTNPLKNPIKNIDKQAYLPYCDSHYLRNYKGASFTKDMNEAFRVSLGMKVILYPFSCEQLLGLTTLTPNVIGEIVGFHYSSETEFLQSLDCKKTSLQPFGFCLPAGGISRASAEAEIRSAQKIIPVASFDNEFLEFF